MLSKIKKKIKKAVQGDYPIEDLVASGLKLGGNVNIQKGVIIDVSHCWLIEIGDDVVIAPRAIILSHDTSTIHGKSARIGKVKIGSKTFVGAGAIILPGVNIGERVVVAAGSVVSKDVPNNAIVAGNPAKVIGNSQTSEEKHEINIRSSEYPVYMWPEWGVEGGITDDQKEMMKKDLEKSRFGYLINDKF